MLSRLKPEELKRHIIYHENRIKSIEKMYFLKAKDDTLYHRVRIHYISSLMPAEETIELPVTISKSPGTKNRVRFWFRGLAQKAIELLKLI